MAIAEKLEGGERRDIVQVSARSNKKRKFNPNLKRQNIKK